MHIQWYTVYIIAIYNAYTCITICNVYTCPPDQLIRQGYESAPGLDIMLLKQQVLHVSRQASTSGSQAPPVQNIYRSSHPLLQFLPQKLAEWIADNLAEDLQLPPKPRQSEPWSTAALNQILQTCFVSDSHGIMSQHSYLHYSWIWVRPISRGHASSVLPIQSRPPSISWKKC